MKPRSLAEIDAEIALHLADPGTRSWVREFLQSALSRDPVDALRDVEDVADMLRERLDAMIADLDECALAQPSGGASGIARLGLVSSRLDRCCGLVPSAPNARSTPFRPRA